MTGDPARELHAQRIMRGTHRRRLHELPWSLLPAGTFVLVDSTPAVVTARELVEWTHDGYGSRLPRPRRGTARVITPPAIVAALRAGYPVQIDASATGERA